MSNTTICDHCDERVEGLGMMTTETECPHCGNTTSVTPVGGTPH